MSFMSFKCMFSQQLKLYLSHIIAAHGYTKIHNGTLMLVVSVPLHAVTSKLNTLQSKLIFKHIINDKHCIKCQCPRGSGLLRLLDKHSDCRSSFEPFWPLYSVCCFFALLLVDFTCFVFFFVLFFYCFCP